jgi:hypothetical protein
MIAERSIEQRYAGLRENLKPHNDMVRHRTGCIVCKNNPEETVYGATDGLLEGPFCGEECRWRWENR